MLLTVHDDIFPQIGTGVLSYDPSTYPPATNPVFKAEATVSTGYTDISTIENWAIYGGETQLITKEIKDEIEALVVAKTFASCTDEEKDIASIWFVVDKSDRDTRHTATQQEANAEILTRNVLTQVSEEKIILFRDTIKDDNAANIKTAISNIGGSIAWSLSPKVIVHINGYLIKGNAATLDGEGYGASAAFVLGPYNLRELPNSVSGQDVGDAVSIQQIIPSNRSDNSDIKIRFYLVQDNNTNSGNVRLVLGERHASDGDSISPQTVNDHANIVVAVPSVSYGKFTVEMILNGTSLDNEDSMIIHFGRDGEDSLDTHSDRIFITDMEIEYKL